MFINQVPHFPRLNFLKQVRHLDPLSCPLCCVPTSSGKALSPYWVLFSICVPTSADRLSQTCSASSVAGIRGGDCKLSVIFIFIGDIGRPLMSNPKFQTVIFWGVVAIDKFRHRVRVSDATAVQGPHWLVKVNHPLHSFAKVPFLLQLCEPHQLIPAASRDCTSQVVKNVAHTSLKYACLFIYKSYMD